MDWVVIEDGKRLYSGAFLIQRKLRLGGKYGMMNPIIDARVNTGDTIAIFMEYGLSWGLLFRRLC